MNEELMSSMQGYMSCLSLNSSRVWDLTSDVSRSSSGVKGLSVVQFVHHIISCHQFE